jgi:AcrR family transcriptional regulator
MEVESSNPGEAQMKVSSSENSVRQRIVAEARRHFFTYGFRRVTMDDLARELGMSKKTLYVHFASKAELLQAVLLDKTRNVETDLKRITSDLSSDFLAALHKLLAVIQGHMGEIQPPFVRDIQREAPEMFKLIERRRRDLIHLYFGKLVEEGRKSGIIRDDIPTRLIVEILFAAVQGIMNPEKLTELDLNPKEGFSAIVTIIFEGVITETGRSNL